MTVLPDARYIMGAYVDWDHVTRESYFNDIPSLVNADMIKLPSQVTFLEGENGSGKSSFLEALASACGFDRAGGNVLDYRHADEQSSDLGHALHVMRTSRPIDRGFFFRAETFFDMAPIMSRGYGEHSSYSEMSHGEGFLAFLQSQQYSGLFLMDEPEAALSPQRQLSLLLHMYYMAMSGSQFVIVTHSPVLLGFPNAAIMHFDDDGIHEIDYEDTEAYQITKMFLTDREAILHHLLNGDG